MDRRELSSLLAVMAAFVALANVPSLALLRVGGVVLLAVLLGVGVGSQRRLMVMILALFPIMPYELVLWNLPAFEVSFRRVAILLVLGLWAWRWVMSPQRWPGRTGPMLYALTALSLVEVLHACFGGGPISERIGRTVAFFVEVAALSLAYAWWFDEESLPRLVTGFAAGCLVLVACVIGERLVGVDVLFRFPPLGQFYEQLQRTEIFRDGVMRVRGSFRNSVYLAGFLPLMMFAGFYLIVIRRSTVAGAVVSFGALLASLLTVSRTALYGTILMIGFGIAAVAAADWRWQRLWQLSLAIVAVVGVAYLLAGDDLIRGVTLAANPTAAFAGSSSQDRIDIVSRGLPLVISGPALGISAAAVADMQTQIGFTDVANFYVNYGLSHGWLWVLTFLVLMAAMAVEMAWHLDLCNMLLLALVGTIALTYLAYSDYWVSFTILLIFSLVHNKGSRGTRGVEPPALVTTS